MEVHIFDVEHGFCSAVIAPSKNVLLIDSGHNDTTGWRPSTWLANQGLTIANLTISNFDEDHLTDLPNLKRAISIGSLTVNWNLTPDWVCRAKQVSGMGLGVRAAIQMMEEHQGGKPAEIDWGGCDIKWFFHPPTLFSDENNLSVVTFVHYAGIRIVFPGDLNAAGWQAFLRDNVFLRWLRETNIFVTSHHGRDDGYCPEVFNHCHPSVIIISDKNVMYETQRVDYTRHAKGIQWTQTEMRYCLTTRRDGKITITPTAGGGGWISATG